MKNIIIISDIFKEDYEHANIPIGGAELNDDVLFEHLKKHELVRHKIHSNEFEPKEMIKFIRQNVDCVYLISNFANLHFRVLSVILRECNYVIYEHDYKFHKYRNPIDYCNYIVPKKELINVNFYKNAKKVICLSKLHMDIFFNNLKIDNLYNTTCSLWSNSDLEFIKQNNKIKKNNKLAIVDTNNPIKRKQECEMYCVSNGLEYDLISSPNYRDFLQLLAKYKGVVILPGHPEPTPRVAVEAKMLNCEIYSNKNSLGVAHEQWFELDGDELVHKIKNINIKTLDYITELLNT